VSVAVGLDKLRDEVERYGFTPYLLTVSPEGRPHAVALPVAWEGDRLIGAAGRKTAANVAAHGVVTLLWPPAEVDGYTLIVDGEGVVDGEQVRVEPMKALLHRPAPGASINECGHDCVAVFDR
jgi:hypothetical protein